MNIEKKLIILLFLVSFILLPTSSMGQNVPVKSQFDTDMYKIITIYGKRTIELCGPQHITGNK